MTPKFFIKIDIQTQRLILFKNDRPSKSYPISSAKNGLGEEKNSFKTPRGKHIIRAKIGHNVPKLAVFKARRWTGEICFAENFAQEPERDWILTRILWLSGCERGKNRLGNVDTMQRYIYIHGTPELNQLGTPVSHGCIRMDNDDLIELFDLVPVGTCVDILETLKS